MIKDAQVFEYPSSPIKQEDISTWLDTLGPKSPDHRSSLIEWVIQGEKLMIEDSKRKRAVGAHVENESWTNRIPGFEIVSTQFDELFRPMISYTFFVCGKDSYSKFAKITLFVLLVLIPGFILFVLGGLAKVLDVVDPLPEYKSSQQQD